MSAQSRTRWIRGIGLAGIAAAIALAAPAAAFAATVTSPTGMVTASGPDTIQSGVATTFTETVTNTTSSPFDGPVGVVASGSMPSGITVQGIKGCTNLGGGGQSTSFLCGMPNLAAGASESMTFTLVGSAAGDYQIPIGASAEIADPACGTGCQDAVGDSVDLPLTVQPGSTDIQVTGSSNNGSPSVGSTFSYTFQVKDNGPLAASTVTFDDSLPAAIVLGGTLTVDRGTCTASAATNSVHCDIGTLAVGQQSDITFTASPTATGTFANTASVTMLNPDSRPANNTVTVTVQPR